MRNISIASGTVGSLFHIENRQMNEIKRNCKNNLKKAEKEGKRVQRTNETSGKQIER